MYTINIYLRNGEKTVIPHINSISYSFPNDTVTVSDDDIPNTIIISHREPCSISFNGSDGMAYFIGTELNGFSIIKE